MDPIPTRTSPLSILIVPADAQPDMAPSLSALKSHWTLVCPVTANVVEAARWFEPDIVLVDELVPGLLSLPFQLAASATDRSPVLVVMSRSAVGTRAIPPGYSHSLFLPTTAVEVDQVLWQVRGTALGQLPDRTGLPDTGMIG
jgi:hypothetical protein